MTTATDTNTERIARLEGAYEHLATKADLAQMELRLTQEMSQMESRMTQEVSRVAQEITQAEVAHEARDSAGGVAHGAGNVAADAGYGAVGNAHGATGVAHDLAADWRGGRDHSGRGTYGAVFVGAFRGLASRWARCGLLA